MSSVASAIESNHSHAGGEGHYCLAGQPKANATRGSLLHAVRVLLVV